VHFLRVSVGIVRALCQLLQLRRTGDSLLNEQPELIGRAAGEQIACILEGYVLEGDVDTFEPVARLQTTTGSRWTMVVEGAHEDPIAPASTNLETESYDIVGHQVNSYQIALSRWV